MHAREIIPGRGHKKCSDEGRPELYLKENIKSCSIGEEGGGGGRTR